MAKFYVGQRVRIVRGTFRYYIGREATIVSFSPMDGLSFCGDDDVTVAVDGIHSGQADGYFGVRRSCLAPLTDPKADEFIERIKKIAREPTNVTVKERA